MFFNLSKVKKKNYKIPDKSSNLRFINYEILRNGSFAIHCSLETYRLRRFVEKLLNKISLS